VWNASQKQHLETFKVGSSENGAGGILSMIFCAGEKRLLCSFSDGSVQVFNVQNMQLEYASSAGHTETIFDCKMNPMSPDIFSTASYDGFFFFSY
jgi:WD40 repeat protein